jgi:hypothetical protein
MKKFLLAAALLLPNTVEAQDFQLDKDGDLVISGVQVGQEGNLLVIRIEGGTIKLPKSSIIKQTPNGLTVADVEALESTNAEARAQAELARQTWLAEQRLIAAENRARQRIKDTEREAQRRLRNYNARSRTNTRRLPRTFRSRYTPGYRYNYFPRYYYNPAIRSRVIIRSRTRNRICR